MFLQFQKKISEYVKVKTDQIKLDVAGHISRIMTLVIGYLIIAVLFLFFILFLSIALANYLNYLFGNPVYGYLIIAGIVFLKVLIIFILVKSGKLDKMLEKAILKSMGYKGKDE